MTPAQERRIRRVGFLAGIGLGALMIGLIGWIGFDAMDHREDLARERQSFMAEIRACEGTTRSAKSWAECEARVAEAWHAEGRATGGSASRPEHAER